MTTWVLPIAATIVATGLTYFFCLRPMLRGQHCMQPSTTGSPSPDIEEQICEARAELTCLRAGEG